LKGIFEYILISALNSENRALRLGLLYVKRDDPRQAYIIMKEIMAHPDASYQQRYQAMEGLALTFNCSRHLDINARTPVDINRDDDAMNELVRVILYPESYIGKEKYFWSIVNHFLLDYRSISFDQHVEYQLNLWDTQKVIHLANTLFARLQTHSSTRSEIEAQVFTMLGIMNLILLISLLFIRTR
jgi:hypothetical protein